MGNETLQCEICEAEPATVASVFCENCTPLAEEFTAADKAVFDEKFLIRFEITVSRNNRAATFKIEGYQLSHIARDLNTVLNGKDVQEIAN